MRIFALVAIGGLLAGSAMAYAGSDTPATPAQAPTTPGQTVTPPPIPSAKKSGANDTKGGTDAPRTDLTFADVEGVWTGTVDEVDQDPYTINLTFHAGGLGEVTYSGYNCAGVLGPLTQGTKLVFKETITRGRQICADGTVVLTSQGTGFNWTWINEWNEVQATAVLRRAP